MKQNPKPKAFFLLMPGAITLPRKEMETKEYLFNDLFEMLTGVVDSKGALRTSEDHSDIAILRINSFTDEGALIENIETGTDTNSASKSGAGKGDIILSANTISESKIITRNDFIIYTRGLPKGFSALRFVKTEEDRFAASHHFIYLRPRLGLINIYVPYLHLMLELFVKKDLAEIYKQKAIDNRSTQPAGNSISVKELKNLKITLLTGFDAQKKVVEKYERQKSEVKTALEILDFMEAFIHSSTFMAGN